MANSFVRINVHLVFHVKTTSDPIRKEDLPNLFRYIGGIIKNLGGKPIEIGGVRDHIHVLALLPKTMSLSDFVRDIKSNTSRWIKQLSPYYRRFCWQDGFGAFSVSPSMLERTVRYIQNQETHHKKRTFRDELKLFLEAYGVDYDEHYLGVGP